ncbi:MAG: class I SAM-dependent methyltransferase [Burkholderiales bacterium]
MTNIDWSVYLRLKRNPLLNKAVPLFVRGERLQRFRTLPNNLLVHDLKKGIPFADDSVEVVYHSHMLEHLDRDIAKTFLVEVRRVLKPGGIQRIAVPDFEEAAREYLGHIPVCESDPLEAEKHGDYIGAMIEQSVRREGFGTSQQKPLRRRIENIVLGDARKRGETHQWMYDWIHLKSVLLGLKFSDIRRYQYNTSQVPNWNDYGLDLDENGKEYKPESFYVEAIK